MKIKNFMFIWFLTIFSVLSVPSVMADTIVVGTGDPEVDVPAIQTAVNGGGTVILRGNFQFNGYSGGWGDYFGYVGVANSVEIVGENATIYGGAFPFWVRAPGSNVTIRGSDYNNGLTFENPLWVAIVLKAGASINIKNVDIDGVSRPFWDEKFGIAAFSDWDDTHEISLPLMIGKLSIVDCTIDLGDYADDTVFGRGIFTDGVGTPENKTDILIKGNTIRNCSWHGMGLFAMAGKLTVKDNYIRPGNKGYNDPDTTAANGIFTNQGGWVYKFPDDSIQSYQPEWLRFAIENNDIYCEPNTFANGNKALGIFAMRQFGTIIKNNKIKVDGGYACISVWAETDGFAIKGNTCSGIDMEMAIRTWETAKNSKIENNDLSEAKPLSAQIWIDPGSHNHLLVNNEIGPPGSDGGIYCDGYENRIVNNTFHGVYPGWTTGVGFIWLDSDSEDNKVAALKKATPPHGFDICDQVMDDGINNKIPGYKKCDH